MKIVMPGGTGQIGGVLARALRARGDEVVGLGRGGVTRSNLAPAAATRSAMAAANLFARRALPISAGRPRRA